MAIPMTKHQKHKWLLMHMGEIAADMRVLGRSRTAALWKVHQTTLYQYQNLGQLPPDKDCGIIEVAFRVKQIEKVLE
jgi:hypothetical protein